MDFMHFTTVDDVLQLYIVKLYLCEVYYHQMILYRTNNLKKTKKLSFILYTINCIE